MISTALQIWDRTCRYALAQSRLIAAFIENNVGRLLACWIGAVALVSAGKLAVLYQFLPQAFSPSSVPWLIAPYAAVALAPVLAIALVRRAFPADAPPVQPDIRLARIGRWHQLDGQRARTADGYGIEGFLASLVAGLVLSILVRLLEYAAAMPAVPLHAPAWATALFTAMTLDLVLLSFLYATCLAMALRGAPLFPRMLVYTWLYDILMQLLIARYAMAAGDLPSDIAGPLQEYLTTNVKKVLISVAIWLPYLLLSKRINLTFRHRIAAA